MGYWKLLKIVRDKKFTIEIKEMSSNFRLDKLKEKSN
jgi:hypothetical protein